MPSVSSNGIKIGRRLALTPELQEAYVNAVKDLRYLNLAADLVGLHVQTINRWRKFGRLHDEKFHPDGDDCSSICDEESVAFRSFYLAVKQAIAQSVRTDLNEIETIAKRANKWEGIAWKLERTMPDKFGLKNRVDHNYSGKIEHVHKLVPLEQRQRLLKAANDALTLESAQEIEEAEVVSPVQDED